ncbi:MAG: hypothetical protein NVS2B12_04950 [Ktedonobacteraceae bacterium]
MATEDSQEEVLSRHLWATFVCPWERLAGAQGKQEKLDFYLCSPTERIPSHLAVCVAAGGAYVARAVVVSAPGAVVPLAARVEEHQRIDIPSLAHNPASYPYPESAVDTSAALDL